MVSNFLFNTTFIGDFLTKLAEKSESVYWLSSPDFKKIVYISPAFEKIWGRSRDILYSNPEVWITYLHPDDAKNYHPIHAMAEKVATLGPNARYEESYRIVRPNDEIRWIIDRGFPVYEGGICHGVTGVAIDVTKDKQHEQELKEAKIKAEKANEAKTYFLASMSHELRTPLNGILGMAQVLSLTSLTKEQREYIEDILTSGKHLLSLVNDTLDFSKLESGKIDIYPAPVSLQALIDEITSMLSFQARAKNIDLVISYPPSLPYRVIADAKCLRQVLINIIGNAIKFTEKGKVQIYVSCTDICEHVANLIFEISDTGIGIPQDKLDYIFEKFTQVDSSYTRNYEGAGLGLAITKKLVDLMGGTITVRSILGEGTTCTLSLAFPLQEGFSTDFPWEHYKNTVKILIVDDCSRGQVLAKNLESANVEVVKSSAALNTLRSAQSQNDPFQIIMIDDQLTNISAESLLAEIVSTKALMQPLPILMANPCKTGTNCLAKNGGFFECMVKPIQPRELSIKITAAWEKWSEEKNKFIRI